MVFYPFVITCGADRMEIGAGLAHWKINGKLFHWCIMWWPIAWLHDLLLYNIGNLLPSCKGHLTRLLERLEQQGFIEKNPQKHWEKNEITCKIDIISITRKPLAQITPMMEAQFKEHIQALLHIRVIRKSSSQHGTKAIMVNTGTTVDPKMDRESKGKPRIAFDYRMLNENTCKDQYSWSGINAILKKVGRRKVYSKFDLKSDFHQIVMAEESIPWTTFFVPGGLYQWPIMPFNLKNAPATY